MKQPTTRSRHQAEKLPTENQQNLDRFYWELNRCLQHNPDHKASHSNESYEANGCLAYLLGVSLYWYASILFRTWKLPPLRKKPTTLYSTLPQLTDTSQLVCQMRIADDMDELVIRLLATKEES
ncbi:MAG: hypothetical protein AAF944_25585 [Bacteroidota bacterium]